MDVGFGAVRWDDWERWRLRKGGGDAIGTLAVEDLNSVVSLRLFSTLGKTMRCIYVYISPSDRLDLIKMKSIRLDPLLPSSI